MKNSPAVYLRLYFHAATLTLKAVGARWPWLLVAPLVYVLLRMIQQLVGRAFSGGLAGGILAAFIGSLALSLVLYVGRALLERRRLDADDLRTGLVAFLGDVMTVFFLLWIVSLLLGMVLPVLPILLYAAIWIMPTFEIVALTPVSGVGIIETAFRFMRREALPWLGGNLLLLGLLPLWLLWQVILGFVPLGLLPRALALPVHDLLNAVPFALLFLAYLYRGVLYLQLDSTSPHARRARFGGG